MKKRITSHFFKWYLKRMRFYLLNGDTVLLEFGFGMQALFTSLLSLHFDQSLLDQTKVFLWLNALFALPQVALAFSDNYYHRHWSNWITFVLSMCVSLSLTTSNTEQIAVYGYGFLGLATLHAAFLVNAKMHKRKFHVNNHNQGDELGSDQPV